MRNSGKFYDDKHFPHGFNRSGIFTINEAALLENYGRTMQALQDGIFAPGEESEHQFLAEINGQQAVMSDFGRCWIKYSTQISQKVRRYTLCASQRVQKGMHEEDDDIGADDDIDF
ncbi:DUF413 domain-containing protein [Photobacterium lipolyticum]|uniref:Macrodomain Ori protein n=1 Tax=Photobacterium lipolyticum TaxID=266810 RepID=A0A2T3N008_9GAMM|nr:DUF413 domain-containing protein [Photobacterium lipolyticum]PSW05506.1 hypothetical protein C9I89_09680 [Photobacterium lipolyticum]